MTDTTQPAPITVNANPNKDTGEAFIRQLFTVAGSACTLFGLTHLSSEIGVASALAGPIATLVSMGWGLWKTRAIASKAATMAGALPDNVATTK